MEQRADVFVLFFSRIVDMYNSKLFRVRIGRDEIARLHDRIGYATCFPFYQPENGHFDLDLNYHDQRICLKILVGLNRKEKSGNIYEIEYYEANGTYNPLNLGIPNSWDTSPPVGGKVSLTYNCAPEYRKFDARKVYAETYGYFNYDIGPDDVMWWTGLKEVHSDIIDFLEFLIGNFNSVQEAFTAFDGEGGNDQINFKEFKKGILDYNCKKYDGPEQDKRIRNVFLYLDPGKEGAISRKEWDLLNQLWNEFHLSIYEFVQFLVRTFGPDLNESWKRLDDDGGGTISEAEWMQAVENLGFFGPANVIFALLDSSDDGDIERTEFQKLHDYIHECPIK